MTGHLSASFTGMTKVIFSPAANVVMID